MRAYVAILSRNLVPKLMHVFISCDPFYDSCA